MCGIIGISSHKSVSANIISSLKKLEYRGYDSAGLATLFNGEINEVKSKGRVDELEQNFNLKDLKGNVGIGHVRWATHGSPLMQRTWTQILCQGWLLTIDRRHPSQKKEK